MKKDLSTLLIPPVINPVSTDQALNFIPVGLLALLASLKQDGIEADIYRPHILIARDADFRNVAEDILALKPRIIGFSTWCDSFPFSLILADEIKKIIPDLPVIFGGPQASILAEETLQRYPFIDFILSGEADYSLPVLVKKILTGQTNNLKDLKGLIYKNPDSGKTISNPESEPIEDLNTLPVPSYEKIIQKNKLRIDAGRGCPYKCTYCSTNMFFSRKYRVKGADRLLKEMEYCKEKTGVTSLGISHDMFTLDKKLVYGFTGLLKNVNRKDRVPFTWTCSARTDCVNEEMLSEMRESGCKAMFFGIETGSSRMQGLINKNLDLDKAFRMVKHSTELGMVTIVSYMAGFPDETRQDLNDTLNSIVKMLTMGARPQLTMLSVLPGTKIYEEHFDELEYDGTYSGFSASYLTDVARSWVEKEKKLFSSFYYLPNKHISRDTYIFLANVVYFLEQFIPTLLMLRDPILRDIEKVDLLEQVEKIIPEYENGEEAVLPAIFFITDALKKYLVNIQNQGLAPYCWDVFQADFTKAFMIAQYNQWQLANAGNSRILSRPSVIGMRDMIRPRTYWKPIESEYNVYDYLLNPVQMPSKNRIRKGRFHYLILPVSHRMARIGKVPLKNAPVYQNLRKVSVEEFIEENVVHLDKDKLIKLLKRMIRLGLIDLEPSLQVD